MMFLDLDMLLLSKLPNCFYFSLITPFSVFFFRNPNVNFIVLQECMLSNSKQENLDFWICF
jgi:hypothetical protein